MKQAGLPAACCLLATAAALGADPALVEGTWLNGDGDGWIELAIEDDQLVGRIAGSPDDPEGRRPARQDVRNPDPALRSRRLLGLVILSGFRRDGDRWTGGRIYDPNSGNTYRGTITVVDRDTLSLRGYVGISLFGRSENWKRRRNRVKVIY